MNFVKTMMVLKPQMPEFIVYKLNKYQLVKTDNTKKLF